MEAAAAAAAAAADANTARAAADAARQAQERDAVLNEARAAAARKTPDLPQALDRESDELAEKMLADPRAVILAVPVAIKSEFQTSAS